MHFIHDPYQVTVFLNSLCGDSKLKAQFKDGLSTACIDPSTWTAYFPTPPAIASDHDAMMYMGLMCHETGHAMLGLHRDILLTTLAMKLDMSSLRGKVANVISDYPNDFQWEKLGYTGADQAVEYVQNHFCTEGYENVRGILTKPMSDIQKYMTEIFSWIYVTRSKRHRLMRVIADQWERLIPITRFQKHTEELNSIVEVNHFWDFVEKLLPEDYKEENPPPKRKRPGEGGDKEEEGQGGEGGETDGKGRPLTKKEKEALKKLAEKLGIHDHEGAFNPSGMSDKSDKGGSYVFRRQYYEVDMRKGVRDGRVLIGRK